MLAALFRLAPFLAEEKARTSGGTRAASAPFLRERDTRCAEDHHRDQDNCRAPHVDLLLLVTCCLLLVTSKFWLRYLPTMCAVDRSFSAQMNSISSPLGTIF